MFKTIMMTFKLTELMLVITRVRLLHFIKQYKDTLQRRLMILLSFCCKFIRVYRAPTTIRIKKDLTELLQK